MVSARTCRTNGTKSGLRTRRQAALQAIVIAAAAVICSGAQAESLTDALRDAYHYNPLLDAQRATQRAIDEGVTQARAGYRPDVIGNGDLNAQKQRSDSGDSRTRSGGFSIDVTQNIYNGFQVINGVRQAKANVRAGQADLRSLENDVLLSAATAYMDVVRDQEVVRLRNFEIKVLSRDLEVTEARLKVREVTLTDVAQARAERARAVADAELAKSNLKTSRATYEQVVGHAPSKLRLPSLRVPYVPDRLEEAWEIAAQESPVIIGALYREQAARYGVDRTRGELLPSVSLEASYAHRNRRTTTDGTGGGATFAAGATGGTTGGLGGFGDSDGRTDTLSVTGRLRVPFYQGGEVHSRVREAKHTHVSLLQQVEQARSEAQANVTTAWSRLVASRARLQSRKLQVSATKLALEGLRAEEKVGQRTLQDVLDAERDYYQAQVDEQTTKRDIVVASYAVIAATGRLTAEYIELTDTVYDAEVHAQEVDRKWIGTSIVHREPEEPELAEPVYESVKDGGMVVEESVASGPPVIIESAGVAPERHTRGLRTGPVWPDEALK